MAPCAPVRSSRAWVAPDVSLGSSVVSARCTSHCRHGVVMDETGWPG